MSDTNAVPASTPEPPAPKAENKMEKFFASVGIGMVIALVVILITETFGVTDLYKRLGTPLEARTATVQVAEAPKAMEKKVEAPKAETPTPSPAAPVPVAAAQAPKAPVDGVALNSSGGRVDLKFDPCACKSCATPPKVKSAHKSTHHPKVAITPEAPKAKEVVVTSAPERIWLWHAHDATSENPKPCIIEYGDGRGLPPYCSALKSVIPRIDGETKHEWLVRVGGGHKPTDTPLYQKKN